MRTTGQQHQALAEASGSTALGRPVSEHSAAEQTTHKETAPTPSAGLLAQTCGWLDYHLSPTGLHLAAVTLHNFVTRLTRLYERETGRFTRAARLGQYVRRWAGVGRWRVTVALCLHARTRRHLRQSGGA